MYSSGVASSGVVSSGVVSSGVSEFRGCEFRGVTPRGTRGILTPQSLSVVLGDCPGPCWMDHGVPRKSVGGGGGELRGCEFRGCVTPELTTGAPLTPELTGNSADPAPAGWSYSIN
eukprot:2211313-Prymnesium_polylepis.2